MSIKTYNPIKLLWAGIALFLFLMIPVFMAVAMIEPFAGQKASLVKRAPCAAECSYQGVLRRSNRGPEWWSFEKNNGDTLSFPNKTSIFERVSYVHEGKRKTKYFEKGGAGYYLTMKDKNGSRSVPGPPTITKR